MSTKSISLQTLQNNIQVSPSRLLLPSFRIIMNCCSFRIQYYRCRPTSNQQLPILIQSSNLTQNYIIYLHTFKYFILFFLFFYFFYLLIHLFSASVDSYHQSSTSTGNLSVWKAESKTFRTCAQHIYLRLGVLPK